MNKNIKKVVEFDINIISLHILIEKEEDLYTAHCLEFDIVSDGKTQKDAINNLTDSIIDHISFCMQMGNLDKIENRAPKEYWDKFYSTKRKKLSQPIKFPKIAPAEKIKSSRLPDIIKNIEFKDIEAYAYA